MATPRASSMASAAARVSVRDVLRVKAVESYMRNFQDESYRLQELLEITLSYGIYCVSRNFQLKGMAVDELRSVTKHEQTKTQDFFVRNASRQRPADAFDSTDPQQLFFKPPHDWRAGEATPKGSTVVHGNQRKTEPTAPLEASEPEVFFLPNEAHKDKMDEIDFYTRVLGKAFVDVAWATYSSRGTSYLGSDQLQERMTRVDQRKRPDLMPQTQLPVCSFVEFLNAYVKTSVAKTSTLAGYHNDDDAVDANADETPRMAPTTVESTAARAVQSRRTLTDPAATAREMQLKPRIPPPTPTARRAGMAGTPRSKSLQHVQSKIQPELRAQKEKLLRVKKNQTQLMKEALARARLDEYAARHNDTTRRGSGAPPLSVKRMPLDKITPGAAALEIVDDFMRSPLMDTFGVDRHPTASARPPAASRKDPLKEELYGNAAHDNSFLGCRKPTAVPPRETEPRNRRSAHATRDYNGWLGDFGPQHSKAVRPAWAADVTDTSDRGGEEGSSDEENYARNGGQRRGRADRFEWKFDLLADPTERKPRSTRTASSMGSVFDEDAGDDDEDLRSVSGSWSAARSDAPDPVFRWLKTAVQ